MIRASENAVTTCPDGNSNKKELSADTDILLTLFFILLLKHLIRQILCQRSIIIYNKKIIIINNALYCDRLNTNALFMRRNNL